MFPSTKNDFDSVEKIESERLEKLVFLARYLSRLIETPSPPPGSLNMSQQLHKIQEIKNVCTAINELTTPFKPTA